MNRFNMITIELEHIDIQKRQRQNMGDLTTLTESIKELGLIQPIVIELITGEDKVLYPRLVAGRRRMEALMKLGFKEVFHGASCDPTKPGFVFYDEQTELKRQLVELEEDIRRKDRTWQEKVIGIDRVHKIKVVTNFEEGVEWGQKQTGELLGMSRAKVCYTLVLAEEILREREGAVAKAETYTDALKILFERQEREAMEEQQRRRALVQQAITPEQNAEGLPLFEQDAVEATKVRLSSIIINDHFNLVADSLAAGSVDGALVLDALRDDELRQVCRLLRGDTYLVTVGSNRGKLEGLDKIPWPVIWNVLGAPPDPNFPFKNNALFFSVYCKGAPKPFNPHPSCVFSANRDGEWPPASLIEFLLRPTSAIGSTILMPCGGPCEAVARLGRFPLSFEPDKARFDAEREALKAHYENTLSKVEFV